MRAIAYIRNREKHDSLEELEEQFRNYCHDNLHQPLRMFVETESMLQHDEHGYPEYRSLYEFLHNSTSDYLVVVPNASHLGSDLEAVTRQMVRLERTGAKVRCYDDDLPDPLQNALRTLGVKGVSRTRSESIQESMRAKALNGRTLGKPPFGYRRGPNGSLEIVKDEASVVELIYRLYTKDSLGLRLIASHLNERGILTKRSSQWNMVTIRYILKNPTYMGTYTRFGLRVPRSHEAIIDPQVFRTAQDRALSRRPVGRVVNSEPFLLSGLASCGYCSNSMMGVTRRQSWKRKDGRRVRGVYRYYQCQSRNNLSTCEYHTWRAALLEGTVLGQLRQALNSRIGSDRSETKRSQAVQDRLDIMVTNAERRLLKATKRTAHGETALATLGDCLDELDEARRRANDHTDGALPTDVLARWQSLPFADRQSFLTEHVETIIVYDDSVDLAI